VTDSLFEQYKAALRRGHMAALAGELDSALEAYEAAARLVPERVLPIASRGTVLHRLDRWPEAIAAFDLALRMAPDDEAALRARARARDERDLPSGAAADYERLAFVLDVAGRSTDAAHAARRAAELEPSASREALANRLAAAAARVAAPMAAGESTTASSPSELDENPENEAAAETFEAIEEAAEPPPAEPSEPEPTPTPQSAALRALAERIAELGTQPKWVDLSDQAIAPSSVVSDGQYWPPVDLPSLPPPPMVGPTPDPETLLAEAADLIAVGDMDAARNKMLIAVMVHRAAGRLDAALEACLQLLTTAPGDPQVHLAIANLQLDRGWTALATEKIELLLRLTSLTGDTQAEADVHGLAAERLRDDSLSTTSAR
jgi:tetratricopeptide (TPR) repeat protein